MPCCTATSCPEGGRGCSRPASWCWRWAASTSPSRTSPTGTSTSGWAWRRRWPRWQLRTWGTCCTPRAWLTTCCRLTVSTGTSTSSTSVSDGPGGSTSSTRAGCSTSVAWPAVVTTGRWSCASTASFCCGTGTGGRCARSCSAWPRCASRTRAPALSRDAPWPTARCRGPGARGGPVAGAVRARLAARRLTLATTAQPRQLLVRSFELWSTTVHVPPVRLRVPVAS